MLDVESLLEAEHDENEVRLAFTLDERLAIAAALKEVYASRQGSNQYVKKELPANRPEAQPGTETRELVARKAGFGSSFGYRQTKAVIEHGAPDVVAVVERGDLLAVRAMPEMKGRFVDWLNAEFGMSERTA